MVSNYQKLALAVVLPTITLSVIAMALIASQPIKTEAVEQRSLPSVIETLSNKKMFERGLIEGFVVATIDPNIISARRGTTVDIPVTIQYLSNVEDGSIVTLSNFRNQFRNFAPSADTGLTDAEFDDLIHNNPTVRGEVPVDSYIRISHSTIRLEPNSSATITLSVSIPNDIPDEVVGRSITIGIGFDMEPQTPQIRGQAPSVTIQVEP